MGVKISSLTEETIERSDHLIVAKGTDSNVKILASDLIGTENNTIDPTDTDDGYVVGSVWVNTVTHSTFVCIDNTTNNAVWAEFITDNSFAFHSHCSCDNITAVEDDTWTAVEPVSHTVNIDETNGHMTWDGAAYEMTINYDGYIRIEVKGSAKWGQGTSFEFVIFKNGITVSEHGNIIFEGNGQKSVFMYGSNVIICNSGDILKLYFRVETSQTINIDFININYERKLF